MCLIAPLRSVIGRHGLGTQGGKEFKASSGTLESLTFPGAALPWSIYMTLLRFRCLPQVFLLTGGTSGCSPSVQHGCGPLCPIWSPRP